MVASTSAWGGLASVMGLLLVVLVWVCTKQCTGTVVSISDGDTISVSRDQ